MTAINKSIFGQPKAKSPGAPETPWDAAGRAVRTEDFMPPGHKSVAELGISETNLMKLVLKTIYQQGLNDAIVLAEATRLHVGVIKELLETMVEQRLVEISGTLPGTAVTEYRYMLTEKGNAWAAAAMAQSNYVGPAPVSMRDYLAQIERQRLSNEHIDRKRLQDCFSQIIVPDTLERRLGPAVNSGRALLLYGAPGNGKSTLAEAIGSVFETEIFVPYCIEVEGELVKIFDPIVHHPKQPKLSAIAGGEADGDDQLEPQFRDRRWVRVKRPVIIVGGELTLDMLDLRYDRDGNFYEAPLHVKAIGGTFVVDDLGRQQVTPSALLNRWIVPMEKKVDYMSLTSGKSFALPFDNVLVFSTNLKPEDLMDPAFLRRIPYKVEVREPTLDQFRLVFDLVTKKRESDIPDEMLDFVVSHITDELGMQLSFYQPKFIVDQIDAAARYLDRPFQFDQDLIEEALHNMVARESQDGDPLQGRTHAQV
jgi:predicted ATPase with chaperone activity